MIIYITSLQKLPPMKRTLENIKDPLFRFFEREVINSNIFSFLSFTIILLYFSFLRPILWDFSGFLLNRENSKEVLLIYWFLLCCRWTLVQSYCMTWLVSYKMFCLFVMERRNKQMTSDHSWKIWWKVTNVDDWLIDWLIDGLNDWWNDWLIDSLNDLFVNMVDEMMIMLISASVDD